MDWIPLMWLRHACWLVVDLLNPHEPPELYVSQERILREFRKTEVPSRDEYGARFRERVKKRMMTGGKCKRPLINRAKVLAFREARRVARPEMPERKEENGS